MKTDFCFRCGTNLIFSESDTTHLSSECEKCGQGYAKEKGTALLDNRGNSSFTISLYGIIFEKEKIAKEQIRRIAEAYVDEYDKRWLTVFIEDVEEELKNPKLNFKKILNLQGTEEIARDYLNRLSKEIKTRMNLHIRKGTSQDIDTLLSITKACAKHMVKKGIFQWNENYPNRNAFENDVARNELYVLLDKNRIMGSIVISTLMDEEYKTVNWLSPDDTSVYIHRLAILPEKQGKGYAQFLMNFAENYAIENSYRSIRLDTFSKNTRNQKFYDLRGYKKLENIYFPKQSVYPFYCYEKIL